MKKSSNYFKSTDKVFLRPQKYSQKYSQEGFYKRAVLKNFKKELVKYSFTTFLKKTPSQMSNMSFPKFLKTHILQNTCESFKIKFEQKQSYRSLKN